MLAVALLGAMAMAQVPPPPDVGTASSTTPKVLDQVRFEQRLNQPLPLDTTFTDDHGRTVKLGDLFGKRPVILVFNYYNCPMLCSQVLNGLTATLSSMRFSVGREFDVVAISIDPHETAPMAAESKQKYTSRYGRHAGDNDWHFLVGDQKNIDAAAEAAGFKYVWDARGKQFAHPSGIIVVTPQGKIAQYYYGIEFSARDLRLATIESSQEHIGTLIDSVTLFCYHYDPATGKYGAMVMNMLRAGGVFTLLLIGGFVVIMLRRERRQEGRTA
jgi:protein SCO1/2